MVKYCLNCGYDLSKLKVSVPQPSSPSTEIEEYFLKKSIQKEKPKKVARRAVIQEESEEEQQDPQQQILRKVAEKLVIKAKKNGDLDVKTKLSSKQQDGLQKARETRNKKIEEEKKKTGAKVYTYPKVAERRAQKAEQEAPKEPEPPKNYYNPYSGIF